MRVPTGFYVLLFAALVVGNMAVYREVFKPPSVEITVFDVGNGRATLVRSPERGVFLIDTGPDASILRALGRALPFWQRHIDAVVLTSTKKSFSGGLPDVTSRYRVARVLSSGTHFSINGAATVTILGPGIISLSYQGTVLGISSTTPAGVYTLGSGARVPQLF